MARLSKSEYRFRKHERVGAAAAEQDAEMLSECFVDSGDLTVLSDCANPKRVILGRTGSGKTALLLQLARAQEHVIWLSPEQLSLSYLSNSSLLPHLSDLGVDLDLFYRLLWRHVFAIELIKERYRITTEHAAQSFLQTILARISVDRRKKAATDYLVKWAEHFWKDTEYRVQEVTKKLEADIRAELGTHVRVLDASLSSGGSITREEKATLVEHAQAVVNKAQIRELFEVVDLLATDILDDPKVRLYLLIDRLDEGWVDDRFRYRLIRALIETLKEFTRVKNAKIIVALRTDLLERVLRDSKVPGFQEEKYSDLFLRLSWAENDLLTLLDRRIAWLIRRTYTKVGVGHRDVFPAKIDELAIDEWLVAQTLRRPRDLITLFNHCIDCAVELTGGDPAMTVTVVKAAEEHHSRDRLNSLLDEWRSVYPDLEVATRFLIQRPETLRASDIPTNELEEFFLEVCAKHDRDAGRLSSKAWEVYDQLTDAREAFHYFLRILYRVGVVGLKTAPYKKTLWSYTGLEEMSASEISDDMHIAVHKVFQRVLGSRPV